MKTNKKNISIHKRKFCFLFISIFFLSVSCNNEDSENLLQKNYSNEDFNQNDGISASGKVLFIVIDGVQGETIRATAPTNIMGLTNNSIYSFSGLADASTNRMTQATGWANLLTGVTSDLHQVKSEDFSGNQLDQYPSIVSLMKKVRPELKSALYSTSTLFSQYFSKDFTAASTFNNDNEKIAAAVLNELQNNNSDLVLAQFNKAQKEGDNFGYNSTEYLNAIKEIDTYIGNLVTTLKARPNYKKENWMVVITTSTGGQLSTNESGKDPFVDESRNTFTLLYNYRFNSKIITKPVQSDVKYTGYGVNYTFGDNNYVNASLKNGSLYDFGRNGEMTVQFMIKSKAGNFGYPTFLSKRNAAFGGAGWNMFLEGDYWVINSSMSWQLYGSKISDGQWHVITAVFNRVDKGGNGDVNKLTIYTDGVKNAEGGWNSVNDQMSNTTPLRIGRIPGNGDNRPEVMVTNLQIYNRVFSDDDVASLSCLPIIKDSHPYFDKLIGYWPGDEVDQQVLKERTHKLGDNTDFLLTGGYSWKDFSEVSSNVCPQAPDSFFRLVPNASDISFQTLQWLGVRIYNDWSLDGQGWPPSYRDIQP